MPLFSQHQVTLFWSKNSLFCSTHIRSEDGDRHVALSGTWLLAFGTCSVLRWKSWIGFVMTLYFCYFVLRTRDVSFRSFTKLSAYRLCLSLSALNLRFRQIQQYNLFFQILLGYKIMKTIISITVSVIRLSLVSMATTEYLRKIWLRN